MNISDLDFDIYQWAKYSLILNNNPVYIFVTTRKPEEECINILKEMAETVYYSTSKYYKIIKKTKSGTTVLYHGNTRAASLNAKPTIKENKKIPIQTEIT